MEYLIPLIIVLVVSAVGGYLYFIFMKEELKKVSKLTKEDQAKVDEIYNRSTESAKKLQDSMHKRRI